MYQTKRDYILPGMKVSELILENPSLLLLLEHFELNFLVHDKSILELCNENKISTEVFISFANLYNGFPPAGISAFSKNDLPSIILFLKNSHNYYENEKYPEIRNYIEQLYHVNSVPEIKLIGKFFDEYFEEVKEHLAYENKVAFPYFYRLLGIKQTGEEETTFSVREYRDHHSDIESKLNDLRELLLKHIPVNNDRVLRRKIITSLFEVEYDLNIHSTIEETILMPLITKLEKSAVE